jgi:hypothetical protein
MRCAGARRQRTDRTARKHSTDRRWGGNSVFAGATSETARQPFARGRRFQQGGSLTVKRKTCLRIDPELLAAMWRVREVESLSVTTQIETAVRAWLTQRGTPIAQPTGHHVDWTRWPRWPPETLRKA